MSDRSEQARHLIERLQSDPSIDEEASCEAAAIASAAAYFSDARTSLRPSSAAGRNRRREAR